MPKTKISREDVLRAAAEVVRKEGERALGARAVAKELGCSTQPIYSLFQNMGDLEAALLEEAKGRYHAFIEGYFAATGKSRYESFGMGFVKFAKEEKGLFRFLFLSERSSETIDPFFEEILGEMCALYGMDRKTAEAFHRDMAIFSYGLAMRANLGDNASEEEISAAFDRQFYALYGYYFPERERFWEK